MLGGGPVGVESLHNNLAGSYRRSSCHYQNIIINHRLRHCRRWLIFITPSHPCDLILQYSAEIHGCLQAGNICLPLLRRATWP